VTAKLIAVVLPLALDTLAVSLALGVAGLTPRRRLRLSLLFAGFEAGMPMIGVAIGAPLGHAIGSVADYIAAGLLLALGLYMLLANDGEQERDRLLTMTERGALGTIAVGVSVSLDELTIGFGASLLRLPIVALVIAIGAQAFLVTQLGTRLGARVNSRAPEFAEKLAGIALTVLGVVLLTEQVTA
jgi:putative Mn2+ efflux pump MntP